MCSPFLLVPGQSRSSRVPCEAQVLKWRLTGRKGVTVHTVSYRVLAQGVNTTPFCASIQALVPWPDTKCGQLFRCFIPIETWVTQHLLNGPHALKQRQRRRQREQQKSKRV